MAYRLKTVRYQNADCKILLQNENGPCPLLAAANALLLRKLISLPSESIRAGVASIDDVVNVLAERALLSTTTSTNSKNIPNASIDSSSIHLHELLDKQFPLLQYGLDVNPKFTEGVNGVEYTSALTTFDLLGVDLVHGWLLDPQDTHMMQLVGNKTYNELVEVVVHGNEADSQVQHLNTQLDEIAASLAKLESDVMDKEKEEEWVNVDTTDAGADVVPTSTDACDGQGANDTPTVVDAPMIVNGEPIQNRKTTAPGASSTVEKETATDPPCLVDDGDSVDSNAAIADSASVNTNTTPTTMSNDTESNNFSAPIETSNVVATSTATQAPSSTVSVAELRAQLNHKQHELENERDRLAVIAANGSVVNSFLSSTGHQLTHYGLHELYAHVKEDALCVFFRNNHFATLTKHEGVLYLLVTDLGYANVPEVMWEKLDGIDGDTEYVNASFCKPAPQAELAPAPGPSLNPEDVLAQRGQVDRDLQLALQLSKHDGGNGGDAIASNMDEEEGKLVAAATEASLRTYNGIPDEEEKVEEVSPPSVEQNPTVASMGLPPTISCIVDGCSTQEDSDKLIAMQMQAQMDHEDASLNLARRLQEEERQRAAAATNNTNTSSPARGWRSKTGSSSSNNGGGSSKDSNCVIS